MTDLRRPVPYSPEGPNQTPHHRYLLLPTYAQARGRSTGLGGQRWTARHNDKKGSGITIKCQNELAGAEIDFGTDPGGELSPLHQISPNEGKTLRIALLDEFCKPRASHYHWYRNGFYRCNTPKDGPEAACCKVQRSWTCVCLAIQYLSADPDCKLRKGADIKYRVGYPRPWGGRCRSTRRLRPPPCPISRCRPVVLRSCAWRPPSWLTKVSRSVPRCTMPC